LLETKVTHSYPICKFAQQINENLLLFLDMDNEFSQIKFGIISELFPSEGLARVEFQDDNIVSHRLQIIFGAVGSTKVLILPEIGEFVACLLDANLENGVILGSLYTGKNKPNFGTKRGFKFGDSEVVFDSANNQISIKSSSKIILEAGTKIEIANTTETLGDVLGDLITAIKAITHTVTAVGAPTGPPINIAQFIAIEARLTTFLD
jgi:phage baseplate assembly protein gpV